jgi:signal transduction histidine kinase
MQRLGRFIRRNSRELAQQCEPAAVATGAAGSARLADTHTGQLLARLAEHIDRNERGRDALRDLATIHAGRSYRAGVSLENVVGGYNLFRHEVLARYAASEEPALRERLESISYLNDAVDAAIAGAIEQFSREVQRDRELLISTVNHDLANEVGVVGMMAASLADHHDLPPALRERASIIGDSARLMGRMLADLTQLTDVRLGGQALLRPQPCDVLSICRRVVQGMLAIAPDRQLSVQGGEAATGRWDPDRLTQLVRNLVANAIKHGTGAVTVAAEATQDHGGVHVTVANDGPIIPPPTLQALLGRLRADPMPPSSRPGGLGLYVVKTIAEAHGGHVSARSTPETGTVFTVWLPRDAHVTQQ